MSYLDKKESGLNFIKSQELFLLFYQILDRNELTVDVDLRNFIEHVRGHVGVTSQLTVTVLIELPAHDLGIFGIQVVESNEFTEPVAITTASELQRLTFLEIFFDPLDESGGSRFFLFAFAVGSLAGLGSTFFLLLTIFVVPFASGGGSVTTPAGKKFDLFVGDFREVDGALSEDDFSEFFCFHKLTVGPDFVPTGLLGLTVRLVILFGLLVVGDDHLFQNRLVGHFDDLTVVLGHLLENDDHLLLTQGAFCNRLLSEGGEECPVESREPDTVILLSGLNSLLGLSLVFLEDSDESLESPNPVGRELTTDISGNEFLSQFHVPYHDMNL